MNVGLGSRYLKAMFALVGVLLVSSLQLHAGSASSPTRQIVENMLSAIAKHRTASFTMHAFEKLVGKNESRLMDINTKINISPLKIYAKVLSDPNKGTELLFCTGRRENKLRVNPGKFLPTLTLAPTSSLVTKDQHHTLLTSGFMIVHRIVSDGMKRADDKGKFDEVFKYMGEINYQGKKCIKIQIDDPSFGYTTALGQNGETLHTMAKRILVSEYHLMELNGYKSFEESVAGKTLKTPTSYAKRTTLYIDETTNFPIYQEMSDDKGVFERYEYGNLVINPAFAPEEFNEDFPAYKF